MAKKKNQSEQQYLLNIFIYFIYISAENLNILY